jgi:16S rRNA (uracil1498-N3)-methyltransferase
MQLFFSDNIQDNIVYLDKSESHHCIHVLRKIKGDVITIIDGKGNFIEGEIITANSKQVEANIISQKLQSQNLTPFLHIAIAPTKNIDRFEWFLEKATEIGISEITPLLCRHSERKTLNDERCHKIILSAIKQSEKAWLPKLNPLQTFSSFISQEHTAEKLIAHCNEDVKLQLKDFESAQNILVLIGPEGDFSKEEIASASEKGLKNLSLGNSRLRTETAGVYVCAAVSSLQTNKFLH